MVRYIRAFFLALKMTLKGEKPPENPYAPLLAWIKHSRELVEAVYAAADANGMNKTARSRIVLRIDGRDISMQTILAGVEYHLQQEYPYLLRNFTAHSITAIYASNLNDQYSVMRLHEAEAIQNPAVREALSRLSQQLNAIPTSNFSNAALK